MSTEFEKLEQRIKDDHVAGLLEEIRDRLPEPSPRTLQIGRSDHRAMSANLEAIASGRAVVVPDPPAAPLTYPEGTRFVRRSSSEAMSANLEAIAKGEVVVIGDDEPVPGLPAQAATD